MLKNRQDRIAYLKERAGVPVVDLRLEDPRNFRRKLKDLSAGPALIFVTSREIDQSGEDEMTIAREHMERVLTHLGLAFESWLRRAWNTLSSPPTTAICTARN